MATMFVIFSIPAVAVMVCAVAQNIKSFKNKY